MIWGGNKNSEEGGTPANVELRSYPELKCLEFTLLSSKKDVEEKIPNGQRYWTIISQKKSRTRRYSLETIIRSTETR